MSNIKLKEDIDSGVGMIPIAKPALGKEEIDAVVSVLKSGIFTQGEKTAEFEKELGKYCGYRYAVAVNSGTAALHLGMLAMGTKGNVAVPDFSFAATASTAKMCGGTPVFIDVDKRTFNMDSKMLKKSSVEVAVPVSLFGQPYNVTEIISICRENGINVISDNAQSIGAEWEGRKNLGDDISILSFYPTKNITTSEGGAVLTDKKEFADACISLRNHGQTEKYSYDQIGYNYRITEIAAAIGIEQLKKLDTFITKRIRNAGILTELLNNTSIETPFVDNRCKHVFNQYTIITDKRNELIKNLTSNGIGYGIYYPSPLHTHKAFYTKSDCPIAEDLAKKVISLPVYPSLTDDDLQRIADVVKGSV